MSFNAPKSMAEQIAQHLANQIISGERIANERIQELKVVEELEMRLILGLDLMLVVMMG